MFTLIIADYFLTNDKFNIDNPFINIKNSFNKNLFRGLYFDLLATFYWSAANIGNFRRRASAAERQKLIIEKEKAELENMLTKSKNAYLQQQMNPHMLFNTLNFVYNNVQRYSDDAARSIYLLSEIMRFSLKGTEPDGKVLLEDEADQIENLLEINRYRFEDPVYIDVAMEGSFHRYTIIPLILLTLTENVFKHGNLTEAAHPASIRLTVDDRGKLSFSSSNLKKSKNGLQRSQHLGLQNVRIRLDSTYPENYQLDIQEAGNMFELSLTLKL
jgi:LytS/YehU family sensor histidine kinase